MINSTVFLEPEHHNLPLVVYFWKFMTTNFSEFSLYTWVFWACLISTYIVGGLFWVIIDTLGLFQAYKIQPKRKPDGVAYYRVAKNIFTNYVGIILPLSFFKLLPIKNYYRNIFVNGNITKVYNYDHSAITIFYHRRYITIFFTSLVTR